MQLNRLVLKIAGESGMGVESTGLIVMKTLKNLGLHIYGEREFASVIKGVGCNFQIQISKDFVRSMSKSIDIGLALDREGLKDCLETLKPGGLLIHGFERWPKAVKNYPNILEEKQIRAIQLPAREMVLENGGSLIMLNTVLLGQLWQVLNLPIQSLKDQITRQFANKPELLEINYACLEAGFNFASAEKISLNNLEILQPKPGANHSENLIMDGNSAIVFGAVAAGVRAYYAYPMSPSTSILTTFAKLAEKTGILVKQIEDEISVANMTIGSMLAGTRALCGTSGGGFDLMTETVSLAGSIEVPWVCVIAQRPGPATGLPTWTGQADLNLAIHAGHGEFAKCVIAVSSPEDAFTLTQEAFAIADKFQIPVIILTEAAIGMSYKSIVPFPENYLEVNQQLVSSTEIANLQSSDRFKITESGISKRWVVGSGGPRYFSNSDEHLEDGSLTEGSETSQAMIAKRLRKLETLKAELPKPDIFKSGEDSKIGVVGWGSTKNVILDARQELSGQGIAIDCLHYSFLSPLDVESFKNFAAKYSKLVIFEGNATGQLATLLEDKSGIKFDQKFLKSDGRPFYVEEVIEAIRAL